MTIQIAVRNNLRSRISSLLQQEDFNFLLTNRLPRQLATRFMGWFSKIEQPLVRKFSITIWRFFCDVDLSDARHTHFSSLHDCFTRELKPGARTIDARDEVLVSPCDAIVGASGSIQDTQLIQAKGFKYSLQDLLHDDALVNTYRNGSYVTLRLTAGMYHRFHAPHACSIQRVTYISGDTWNVNPIALRRVEKLFCKNERAVIQCRLKNSAHSIAMVPVAAILVASIRLHFLDVLLHLKYRGPNLMPCDAHVQKGEELGWFQHGSTIIVFAPPGFELCADIEEGKNIRMGRALYKFPGS